MFCIVSAKPYDGYMANLYYDAYNAVSLAAYNSAQDLKEKSLTFPQTPDGLCTQLVYYINTTAKSCNTGVVSLSANDITDSKMQFTSTNSMEFYFSAVNTLTVNSGGTTYSFPFRLVFVDLNGKRGPNTAKPDVKNIADIVAFAVTDDGKVVPIGQPEIDTRYMTARVNYPDSRFPNIIVGHSNPYTYYDARSRAWGQNFDVNEVQSFPFANVLPAGSYLKVTYPTTLPVDTTHGCSAAISGCRVEINQS